MGCYIYRNRVVPRTKLYAPKDDFLIPLNHIDVQRHIKTIIDALHKAKIDDYWNVDGDKSLSEPKIGVTRFALLNKKSRKRTYVGTRHTDKETNHYKIWT